MKLNISDDELIRELQLRFEGNSKYLNEQNELLDQLRQVNTKLMASEKLKSNFLSNIRNEINNPLASILELSKHIAAGKLEEEQVKKYANLIYTETFSLEFQLRNIFITAEIEAGECLYSVSSVNVSKIINNVLSSFRHQIEKKNLVLFNVNTSGQEELFHTDSEKLHLMISNLVANAIQFSHDGGKIRVEHAIRDGQLKISILDDGCGIAEEEKDIVFDRFRQGEEGSTKNYGGHGLGLSVTKALLDIVNGSIEMVSFIGAGTTFLVTIPEAEASEDTILSSEGNDFLFSEQDALTF